MDCSKDHEGACLIPSAEAGASMLLATDTVAPQDPLAPSACMVSHGLREHDSVDGKTEAYIPCHLYCYLKTDSQPIKP